MESIVTIRICLADRAADVVDKNVNELCRGGDLELISTYVTPIVSACGGVLMGVFKKRPATPQVVIHLDTPKTMLPPTPEMREALEKAFVDAREKIEVPGQPSERSDPDWSLVRSLARNYVRKVEEKSTTDSSVPHYIFEAVMTCLYGKEFWLWANARGE